MLPLLSVLSLSLSLLPSHSHQLPDFPFSLGPLVTCTRGFILTLSRLGQNFSNLPRLVETDGTKSVHYADLRHGLREPVSEQCFIKSYKAKGQKVNRHKQYSCDKQLWRCSVPRTDWSEGADSFSITAALTPAQLRVAGLYRCSA